jgi:PadR family transcriptional regulator, regulatory protein PadR
MSGGIERRRVIQPGNYLHGCLLLLIAESPTHGYDLVERLSALGLANVDSAAVYRVLRTLNRDGLLESWWEESGAGPVRRRYRISEAGAASLERWAAAVGESASSLSSFVDRHRRLRLAIGACSAG